ncbi:MAG TPA: hypothetical protein DCL76_04415 [Chloroflexi bacterium]|nr:hypothetical protein [Chloroflexota bacterium]HCU97848.1 hypothetical protein [Chloroflexota bacterium]|tara:strand:- start:1084 stop:1494 length:411 start_codon:yes stop_codon:yes gene_type:complete
MNTEKITDRLIEIYITSATLIFIGWGGVLSLLLLTVPTVEARWLFFVLGTSAITGTAMPFVVFLSKRFDKKPIKVNVLLRRSIWVGVIVSILTWLQLGRALTWNISILVISIIIGIEWLIEIRERSLWNPNYHYDK